jgi:hypothetical protein
VIPVLFLWLEKPRSDFKFGYIESVNKRRPLELQAITRQRFAREKIAVQTICLVAVLVCGIGIQSLAENSSRLALAVPYVNQVVAQKKKNSSGTTGVLKPGGSWTSRDGVVISVKPGVISKAINVFAKPIRPAQFPLPMPEGVRPAGPAFLIGTTPKTVLIDGDFDLLIPAPPRVPGEDIRLYVFTPGPLVRLHQGVDFDGDWYELTGDADVLGRYAARTGGLSPKAPIWVTGRVMDSVKSYHPSKNDLNGSKKHSLRLD